MTLCAARSSLTAVGSLQIQELCIAQLFQPVIHGYGAISGSDISHRGHRQHFSISCWYRGITLDLESIQTNPHTSAFDCKKHSDSILAQKSCNEFTSKRNNNGKAC